MESPQHWNGKIRLEKIILEAGWTIYLHDGDDSFVYKIPWLGLREYWPDLLAWHDGQGWTAFEVDGKKGHWTPRDYSKMRLRDRTFADVDIRTVRIQTADLVGKKKQTDSLILEEIEYQLS